jgi:hypothetical protein
MPLDLEKLDAEIRRLQMIRELASDPEGRKTLERFIAPNGNGSGAKLHTSAPAKAAHQSHSQAPQAPQAPRKYGVMKEYALRVVCSTPQTVKQIVDGMIANGWTPTAKDPGPSVTEVLVNLEKKGEVKKASEKGPFGAFMWTK